MGVTTLEEENAKLRGTQSGGNSGSGNIESLLQSVEQLEAEHAALRQETDGDGSAAPSDDMISSMIAEIQDLEAQKSALMGPEFTAKPTDLLFSNEENRGEIA